MEVIFCGAILGLPCPLLAFLIGLAWSAKDQASAKRWRSVTAFVYGVMLISFLLGVLYMNMRYSSGPSYIAPRQHFVRPKPILESIVEAVWPLIAVAGPLGPFLGVAILATVPRRSKVE